MALEVAEAEMGREPAAANDRLDGAVKDIDKTGGIFAVGIAAHRGFVNRYLTATGCNQGLQFAANNGQERFCHCIAVRIPIVGQQPAAERVGPGHACFQRWRLRGVRGEPLQALKLLHRAKPIRRAELTNNGVFAALVVRGRAPKPRRGRLRLDPFQVTIEGQVKVEPGLFTVGDDIGPGFKLVMDGGNHRVIDHFGDVVATELIKMSAGKLKPRPGKGSCRLRLCAEVWVAF